MGHWEKRKFGWVKCNVDAAVFASQGRIGFGCVLRNLEGCFFAARCAGMAGSFGAREAEALGIREALSPNGFGLIIEDCRALIKSIREVQFSFVRRFMNFAAYSIARAASSLSGPQEWNIVPLLWLLNNL
ncbi:uncharacterized protein LOC112099045 [Citrus clementina]|nr:uncharacterized protein LOC112099045 [Citrus x clementina]